LLIFTSTRSESNPLFDAFYTPTAPPAMRPAAIIIPDPAAPFQQMETCLDVGSIAACGKPSRRPEEITRTTFPTRKLPDALSESQRVPILSLWT
jgi:hypothetical protein